MRLVVLLLGAGCGKATSDDSCSTAADTPPLANVQLQNSFRSANLGVVGDDLDSTVTRSLVLDDVGKINTSSRDHRFSAIQQRSTRVRVQSVARILEKSLQDLNESWHESDNEITGVLGKLEGQMSYSQDNCATSLIRYKQKLKQVHKDVTEIATEVKSTESGSKVYGKACKEKETEIYQVEKENKKRVKKCKITRTVQIKTLRVLKKDLYQLKKVSKAKIGIRHQRRGYKKSSYGPHPHPYLGGHKRTSFGNTGGDHQPDRHPQPSNAQRDRQYLGLLESFENSTHDERGDDEARSVHSMVQKTKEVAQKVQQCLAKSELESQKAVSLLGTSEDEGENDNDDLEHSSEVALARIASVAMDGEFVDEDESGTDTNALAAASLDNSSFGDNESSYPPDQIDPKAQACMHKKRGQRCYFAKPVQGPERFKKLRGVCMGRKYKNLKCVRPKVPNACREVVVELERTFTKTYRSVTRLVEEYKKVSHSKVCWETAAQEYQSESSVVQHVANKVCHKEKKAYRSLTKYQAVYKRTVKIEHRLRKELIVTTKQCGNLKKTEKYVNTVKNTIKALGKCPGLGKVKFAVPKWIGAWAYFSQGTSRSNKWNDRRMRRACQKKFSRRGVRPAEVAEINARTIGKMPRRNNADAPVLGACPMCTGKKNGGLSKGGRGRVCWDPKAKFNRKSSRGDCNHGRRAIICILDQGYKGGWKGYKGGRSRYKCLSREQWGPKKRQWCCKHKQLGCEQDKYNCLTRDHWDRQKESWCCKHKNVGCRVQLPQTFGSRANESQQ